MHVDIVIMMYKNAITLSYYEYFDVENKNLYFHLLNKEDLIHFKG